jgi:hypothetical protein
MVLKYVVESVSDTLFGIICGNIVLPHGMTRTFAEVPEALLSQTVSRIMSGESSTGRSGWTRIAAWHGA